ncbi:MAG TPA: hypothetical protein VGJ25_11320 [Gaiellaceae bacterium]
MPPRADEAEHACLRVELQDPPEQRARVLRLLGDDAVADAPPELERHAGEGDRPRGVERAADGVRARIAPRRAAHLVAGERLQPALVPNATEVAVAEREVRVGVECDRAGKLARVARHEQQRLLAAHAAADRVDPVPREAEPRQRAAHDRRHPREV